MEGARSYVFDRDYDQAIKALEPFAMKEGDDQLVYLLEYGTILQMAGRYDDSNKAFMLAAKLADLNDFHSITRIAGSLALNEGMIQYKGEDYEKLLINVYLAQNFLMKKELDEALVEVRRLNELLTKYRIEAKKDYEQNAFAIYLSAIIWEAEHKWDDAYIAYSKVHQLNPDIPMLKEDLLRSSRAAQRMDEYAKWKKTFPDLPTPKHTWKDKTKGELVVIYHQGLGPVKRPNPEAPRFPKLYSVSTETQSVKVLVDGEVKTSSNVIYSVENVAIRTLDDAYAALVAKRVAGMATKLVIADQVRQKNQTLGFLTWVGLNLADQADLRQWSLLPQTFQLARVTLPVGEHKIKLEGLRGDGEASGENLSETTVKISPRGKTFILWRSLR